MKKRQLIAFGGGGFFWEPGNRLDNTLIEQYIIDCTGKKNPKVCFIPTASADSMQYIINFYATFNQLGCQAGHLSLFNQPQRDLESWLRAFDVIYIGGGNTRCMLALWREWNLDLILRRLWEDGVILSGVSAGAMCWFEQGLTDSVPGELSVMNCLGMLKGSFCPHYDSQAERRPAYHRLVGDGSALPGYALDDGAIMHFEDDTLKEIVTSLPNAYAYRVEITAGIIKEQTLKSHYLGAE